MYTSGESVRYVELELKTKGEKKACGGACFGGKKGKKKLAKLNVTRSAAGMLNSFGSYEEHL